MKVIRLAKQTVDILVSDLREERRVIGVVVSGLGDRFVEDRCHFETASLGADLYKAQRRPLVEHHDQQGAADDVDEDTLVFALMDNGREVVFANELCHRAGRRDVAGGKRRKTGGVHVADLAVKGDRLTISVDQEYNARRAFDAEARENGLETLKLMLL